MTLEQQQRRVVSATQNAKDAKIYHKPDAIEKLGVESIALSQMLVDHIKKQDEEIKLLKKLLDDFINTLRNVKDEDSTVS